MLFWTILCPSASVAWCTLILLIDWLIYIHNRIQTNDRKYRNDRLVGSTHLHLPLCTACVKHRQTCVHHMWIGYTRNTSVGQGGGASGRCYVISTTPFGMYISHTTRMGGATHTGHTHPQPNACITYFWTNCIPVEFCTVEYAREAEVHRALCTHLLWKGLCTLNLDQDDC